MQVQVMDGLVAHLITRQAPEEDCYLLLCRPLYLLWRLLATVLFIGHHRPEGKHCLVRTLMLYAGPSILIVPFCPIHTVLHSVYFGSKVTPPSSPCTCLLHTLYYRIVLSFVETRLSLPEPPCLDVYRGFTFPHTL